jgi:hypothetical protein
VAALVEIVADAALIVIGLTWAVMPALTKLFEKWLSKEFPVKGNTMPRRNTPDEDEEFAKPGPTLPPDQQW